MSAKNSPVMNIDKLTLMRLIVAVFHADEKISNKELDHMKEMIAHLELSQSERDLIENELKRPTDLNTLLEEIHFSGEESEKSYILSKVVQAAICDDHLDPKEEELLRKLMAILEVKKG